MKTDLELRRDVEAELAWDPAVTAEGVGVAVTDGVVTLSGQLATFAEKDAVEHAVRRVAGVRGLALDLQVTLGQNHQRTDSEIALAASHALRWNSLVPDERIQLRVENGWVTLSGEVDWAHQVANAEQSVRSLVGVRGLYNRIVVRPRADSHDIAGQIGAALTRHAQREAQRIGIAVDGATVTLTGRVGSLREREAAVGAAVATRGVARVIDHLVVGA